MTRWGAALRSAGGGDAWKDGSRPGTSDQAPESDTASDAVAQGFLRFIHRLKYTKKIPLDLIETMNSSIATVCGGSGMAPRASVRCRAQASSERSLFVFGLGYTTLGLVRRAEAAAAARQTPW